MATRLAPGEKNGRKRMATLGTVYDAEPAVRGIDDIIADPAGPAGPAKERRPGPKARSKWLCRLGERHRRTEARDPDHRRTWVVLVDGARHQLDLIREAGRRNVTVHIVIDIIHVHRDLAQAGGDAALPCGAQGADREAAQRGTPKGHATRFVGTRQHLGPHGMRPGDTVAR